MTMFFVAVVAFVVGFLVGQSKNDKSGSGGSSGSSYPKDPQ